MESVTFATKPLVTKLPRIEADQSGGTTIKSTRHPSLHKQTPPFTGLTGPSYSLSGSKEKFKLPPPSALQPGLENNPGKLDSWPVHPLNRAKSNLSLGQSSQMGSKSLREYPSTSMDQFSPDRKKELVSIASKPKYLERLETHLTKEMRLLGCPPYGPHELRLKAHREVFEYLIEDFKTYKPLLSAIKNEYELYITQQQDLIREMIPLEAQLETVKEDCERKIMSIREEEKHGDAAIQSENQRLEKVVAEMKNKELDYKCQIEKLSDQVQDLYEKHRYEADARKLLISDYNDLKIRQQEQAGEEGEGQEEKEDPVLLKLKLARAREDLKAAHQRINTMLADYGDVVPRREFEMLETSYKTLETETDALKNDHGVLMVEHSTLQSLYKDALGQSQELKEELSQLKRSATPRPDWGRCASYLEGGADKWEELTAGKSSDRMVDVLLAQIAGVDVSEIAKEDTLQGQGVSENVPKYLKFEGQVKNRHITRGETNSLISGFWHHRITTQQDQPLDECLYEFLLSRNDNNEVLAIEDGYNLEESVLRFAHEPHMSLFGQIVRGELSESVFHQWLTTQTALTEAFNKQQTEENIITEGTLKQTLSSGLESRSADQIQALLTIATKVATVQSGVINYIKLLSPDDEGQPSEFVLLLLEQSRKASKGFVTEIMQAFVGKSEVTLSDFDATLKTLDPNKPTEDSHKLYSEVFSLPTDQVPSKEAQQLAITTTQLAEKLHYCGLTRTGR